MNDEMNFPIENPIPKNLDNTLPKEKEGLLNWLKSFFEACLDRISGRYHAYVMEAIDTISKCQKEEVAVLSDIAKKMQDVIGTNTDFTEVSNENMVKAIDVLQSEIDWRRTAYYSIENLSELDMPKGSAYVMAMDNGKASLLVKYCENDVAKYKRVNVSENGISLEALRNKGTILKEFDGDVKDTAHFKECLNVVKEKNTQLINEQMTHVEQIKEIMSEPLRKFYEGDNECMYNDQDGTFRIYNRQTENLLVLSYERDNKGNAQELNGTLYKDVGYIDTSISNKKRCDIFTFRKGDSKNYMKQGLKELNNLQDFETSFLKNYLDFALNDVFENVRSSTQPKDINRNVEVKAKNKDEMER